MRGNQQESPNDILYGTTKPRNKSQSCGEQAHYCWRETPVLMNGSLLNNRLWINNHWLGTDMWMIKDQYFSALQTHWFADNHFTTEPTRPVGLEELLSNMETGYYNDQLLPCNVESDKTILMDPLDRASTMLIIGKVSRTGKRQERPRYIFVQHAQIIERLVKQQGQWLVSPRIWSKHENDRQENHMYRFEPMVYVIDEKIVALINMLSWLPRNSANS